MHQEYEVIDVSNIEYDRDNPRIKKALEKYRDKIDAKRIYFALQTASDGKHTTSSFARLRDSIRARGGITQPITVVADGDNKYVCIDGNTRLAIYKDFLANESPGEWSKIRSMVVQGHTQRDIEIIRISAHLIGPREWPPYEKARYLHYLYYEEFKELSEMIDLCGGNKKDIVRQIDAFNDMNEYYRDRVDDSAFKIDRFSGFVEMQKPEIQQSILEAGFDKKDFADWISSGQIRRLSDVRQLPTVLRNDKAREVFISGGLGSIEKALMVAHSTSQADGDMSLEGLANEVSNRLDNLTRVEIDALQGNDDSALATISALESLHENLGKFLSDYVRD